MEPDRIAPASVATEPEADPVRWTLKRLSLTEFAGGVVGFLYVTGYYINLIFIRNLGITHSELLRLEYVSVGFTFALITFGMVLLPFAAFRLTYRVRRASGLFHFHIGAIGNSLNTCLFIGFPLFLAFFATQYEMARPLALPLFGVSQVSSAILLFVAFAATGTILVPVLERLVTRFISTSSLRSAFRFLIEPIRYGLMLASAFLMFDIAKSFGWTGDLLKAGVYYFVVGAGLVGGLVAATLWVRHIRTVKEMWWVYGLIGFGLAALYYFAVTSYVLGIYRYVPVNRGGGLPLTRAYVDVAPTDERLGHIFPGVGRLRGPVYIIEETNDTLFVGHEHMDAWLREFVPVHAIRKELVPYIRFERITNGFPRVSSAAQTPTVLTSGVKRELLPPEFYDARRIFQYDYIYFDAIGLLLWLTVLLSRHEWRAVAVGAVIAPIVYAIDAHMWWNSPAGPGYSGSTYVREYWIAGHQVPHPFGAFLWPKFGADFMMTVSYALFAFPWLIIVFRQLRQGRLWSRAVLGYTALWATIWFCVPLFSRLVALNDTPVVTVRHMRTQMPGWWLNLALGYALLAIVYRNKLKTVARLFVVGFIGALVMEVPLYLFGIRPTGLAYVVFEGVILLNQGVPFLFLVTDKLVPLLRTRHSRAQPTRA